MKFKTKFDTIVKVKKQKLDEVNRKIGKLDAQIYQIELMIDEIQKNIDNFRHPNKGEFAIFRQFRDLVEKYFRELSFNKEKLKALKNQKKIVIEELKEANMELEKMKFLQGEEIKKQILRLKKIENKQMDEIASMLFANKGDKNE